MRYIGVGVGNWHTRYIGSFAIMSLAHWCWWEEQLVHWCWCWELAHEVHWFIRNWSMRYIGIGTEVLYHWFISNWGIGTLGTLTPSIMHLNFWHWHLTIVCVLQLYLCEDWRVGARRQSGGRASVGDEESNDVDVRVLDSDFERTQVVLCNVVDVGFVLHNNKQMTT